jgi:polyketide cyclase/dehydrase/lipid transport protein
MTQAVKEVKGQAGRASKAGGSASPLQASLQQLAGTVTERAVSSLSDRMGGATDRLTDFAENGGGKGLLEAVTGLEDVSKPVKSMVKKGFGDMGDKVKGLFGGKGKGKGGKKIKLTNIVEHIDVGAPVDLVYRQWTQFAEFPKYMKKLEQVEQVSDEKLQWKAQIFLSHRSWESTITEQVPNERIIWRSKGNKGYIDGAVTFHELAPNLTRVLVVLEYHPQGLFERTGNLWRAQGRRIRLELKHFERQLMTDALLHPDDIEGWLGEIRDGEVVEESSDDSDDEGDEDSGDEDEDEDSGDEDEDEEDSSSSGGQRRRTGAQRRTAGRSGSSRKTSGTTSARKASGTTARKASGSASARKASGTTTSRKSSGTAASRKSSGSSSRTAARTTSSRSSSSRTGSARRRTATK